MIARFALLAGLALFTGANHASGQLAPIAEKGALLSPSYVLQRCEDFAFAVWAYSTSLAHNPVHGTNPDRAVPFAWADEVMHSISSLKEAFGVISNSRDTSLSQDYLDLFGPISTPTLVPNMPLYQADMATCVSAFGKSK